MTSKKATKAKKPVAKKATAKKPAPKTAAVRKRAPRKAPRGRDPEARRALKAVGALLHDQARFLTSGQRGLCETACGVIAELED